MLARVVVVMGVSGAGKTTIGKAVAAELGYMFQDADDLHPRANILRMHAGHPLTDADRAPWLATLVDWLHQRLGANQPAVLACSLLKRRYRDQVIGADPRVALVFLHGTPGLLHTRMRERAGHFMPPALLDSQLETLEPPDDDEHPVRIEIGGTVEDTAKAVLAALR